MVSDDIHLEIGLLAFEGPDQADLTGPFEVLARLPNSTTRIYAKTLDPVRDMQGLRLLPDATLAEAPQLDVLHRRSAAEITAQREATARLVAQRLGIAM